MYLTMLKINAQLKINRHANAARIAVGSYLAEQFCSQIIHPSPPPNLKPGSQSVVWRQTTDGARQGGTFCTATDRVQDDGQVGQVYGQNNFLPVQRGGCGLF